MGLARSKLHPASNVEIKWIKYVYSHTTASVYILRAASMHVRTYFCVPAIQNIRWPGYNAYQVLEIVLYRKLCIGRFHIMLSNKILSYIDNHKTIIERLLLLPLHDVLQQSEHYELIIWIIILQSLLRIPVRVKFSSQLNYVRQCLSSAL